MWWDINQPLSYNALLNFIIGNRGGGKTYGCKDWAIRDFLKTGKQFVYMRRYKQEMKKNKQFFSAIEGAFPDHDLEFSKGVFKIDGETAGYPVALSTAKIEKSTDFPDVNKIVYDEFILDKGVHHYLQDEVTMFLEAYETIARMRDVKVFFLANAITISNPYFAYFDVSLPYGKKIAKKGETLIQLVQNEDFIAAKKLTRFGQLVQNTEYGKYSIDNEFLRDNRIFIQHKTNASKYLYTIQYMNDQIGVWMDGKAGLMFMSADVDPSCKYIVAATTSDHRPNTLLLKGSRKHPMIDNLIRQFTLGNLRFDNVKIKNSFIAIVKITF